MLWRGGLHCLSAWGVFSSSRMAPLLGDWYPKRLRRNFRHRESIRLACLGVDLPCGLDESPERMTGCLGALGDGFTPRPVEDRRPTAGSAKCAEFGRSHLARPNHQIPHELRWDLRRHDIHPFAEPSPTIEMSTEPAVDPTSRSVGWCSCRIISLLVTAVPYHTLTVPECEVDMEQNDMPAPPPSDPTGGLPSGPPPPPLSLPPPPSGPAAPPAPPHVGGSTNPGGVPAAIVGLVAAICLVIGLVVGGVGGALLGGASGGTSSEASPSSRDSDRSQGSTTSPTSRPASTSTTVKQSKAGTRTDPFPVGTPLETSNGIGLVVQSVDLNGDAAVAGVNRFNDPPAPGNRFVLVNVKVTNNSDEPLVPWLSIDVEAIGSANQVRVRCSAVIPDALFDAPDIYPGGETSGNVCVEAPIAEIDDGSLLLLVAASYGDPVFVNPL